MMVFQSVFWALVAIVIGFILALGYLQGIGKEPDFSNMDQRVEDDE